MRNLTENEVSRIQHEVRDYISRKCYTASDRQAVLDRVFKQWYKQHNYSGNYAVSTFLASSKKYDNHAWLQQMVCHGHDLRPECQRDLLF
mgnify:CR=1 FL=1